MSGKLEPKDKDKKSRTNGLIESSTVMRTHTT